MDEQQLVERLKAGDERAVGPLMEQYKSPLFAFIVRMINDYEAAQDVFQDTWIRVVRSIGKFRGDAKFSTWLFQIAINLCRDTLRKRKGKTFVQLEDAAESLSCDPSVNPFAILKAQRVQEVIEELPPKMREVIILKYYHDLSDAEIADIAGCPEGTVKSRVFRGMQIFKKKWEFREKHHSYSEVSHATVR